VRIAQVYPHSTISLPDVQVCDALAIVNYEIARRLARNHSVFVYPRRGAGQTPVEHHEGATWCRMPVGVDRMLSSLKILDTLGLTPVRHPYRSTPLYYAAYARRVACDARARQCDIIHIHSIANFLPVMERINPGAKLVLHMHDHSLADFDTRRALSLLNRATLVLACSEYVANGIRRAFPECADRCFALHNGVDQRFLRIHSEPQLSQSVLFVGRLSPEKGVHVLLEAFADVAANFPRATLRLVGPADIAPRQFVDPFGRDPLLARLGPYYVFPTSYSDNLHRQAAQQRGRVVFEGCIPNCSVQPHYARAGVFVFPSVWHEPFGIPMIEAMAAGLPVIATRGGAISEIVIDGETGLLVDRGDVRQLAAAIAALLASPQMRARLGSAGRERVKRLFTWDRVVERLTAHYDRVCVSVPSMASDKTGRRQLTLPH
jgi:glycosyltransferase involved in cell wall biosynthesis